MESENFDWEHYISTGYVSKEINFDNKKVLYHGTNYFFKNKILEEGLVPSNSPREMTMEIIELCDHSGVSRFNREITNRYGQIGGYINLGSWENANYGNDNETSIFFSESPAFALTYTDGEFVGGEMKSAARACLDLVENFVSSENYHAYQEILTEKQIHYLPKNEILKKLSDLKQKYSFIYEGIEDSLDGLLLVVEFDDSDLPNFRILNQLNQGQAYTSIIPPDKIVAWIKVNGNDWPEFWVPYNERKHQIESSIKFQRMQDSNDLVHQIYQFHSV